MIVEDAAVLAKLFSYLKSEDQISNILWGFQEIRQARCRDTKNAEAQRAQMFIMKYPPGKSARDEAMIEATRDKVPTDTQELPHTLEEPRAFFAYDCDEAGADWWQSWGLLQERARRPNPAGTQVKVDVQVEVEAAQH